MKNKCKVGDDYYTCDDCPINTHGESGVVSKENMNKYGMCVPIDDVNDMSIKDILSMKGIV